MEKIFDEIMAKSKSDEKYKVAQQPSSRIQK